MLLDSDPADGNLEYFVRSGFINDIISDLVFCLHSRVFKGSTCNVYGFLDTLYRCGNDTQKANIRVNFTNLAISNFRGF